MYYTIYKVTNKINSKYYIGMHKTENINDNYLGSGKLIIQSVKKYGRDNFTKEILFVFDNEADMILKEKELVTWDLVESENCYNQTVGGTGGPIWLGRKHSQETKDKLSNSHKGKLFSEEHKQALRISARNRKSSNRKGFSHSYDSKQKIKEARSKQINVVGGLKGKIWITNTITEKVIKLDDEIPLGWIRGRIYRKRNLDV